MEARCRCLGGVAKLGLQLALNQSKRGFESRLPHHAAVEESGCPRLPVKEEIRGFKSRQWRSHPGRVRQWAGLGRVSHGPAGHRLGAVRLGMANQGLQHQQQNDHDDKYGAKTDVHDVSFGGEASG